MTAVFFPKGLCFKNPDKIGFRGNYNLPTFDNKYIQINACDPKKRSTCKSREEIG